MNVVRRLPAIRSVTRRALLAPSVAATSGATLGGQQLGADAAWVGPHLVQTLQRTPAGHRLGVPARSAAGRHAELSGLVSAPILPHNRSSNSESRQS
jgi:hypothetical protein